mmetsp:Transcript_28097/g.68143  ORF Transcript_28097/g.68143 Transcript_28097/m.68143 type:complete len:376 (+) Transcript_28097:2307-3434(+)
MRGGGRDREDVLGAHARRKQRLVRVAPRGVGEEEALVLPHGLCEGLRPALLKHLLQPARPHARGRRRNERRHAGSDGTRGAGGGAAVDDQVAQVVEQLLPAVLVVHELKQLGGCADEGGGGLAGDELRVAEHVEDEWEVGLDATDARLDERAGQLIRSLLEVERRGGHLHEHRVVMRRDLRAWICIPSVKSDAKSFRRAPHLDASGVRAEVLDRIFSRHPRLDSEATHMHVLLREPNLRKLLPRGDPDLRLHEVDAGDDFSHSVLHLDARVDFDEVVLPRLWVDEELHRASVHVPCTLADAYRVGVESVAKLFGQADGGRHLDDLLMAALHGAVAFEQVGRRRAVRQDLYLYVPRRVNVPLNEHGAVAECRLRLA